MFIESSYVHFLCCSFFFFFFFAYCPIRYEETCLYQTNIMIKIQTGTAKTFFKYFPAYHPAFFLIWLRHLHDKVSGIWNLSNWTPSPLFIVSNKKLIDLTFCLPKDCYVFVGRHPTHFKLIYHKKAQICSCPVSNCLEFIDCILAEV